MMHTVVDWLSILVRWGHVIAAITWIGTSFYFNWFDLLVRPTKDPVMKENIRGVIHEIHGGSFYYHEQYWPDKHPASLLNHSGPAQLTFLSGLALIALLYWVGASMYLVDKNVLNLSPVLAVLISMALLALAWPVYYLLVRAFKSELTFAIAFGALILGLSYVLVHLFSARGAFLQLGAMLGTIMALSVHFVIVPNHINMVNQIKNGESVDTEYGWRAKRVSRHNNYITLPVIFAMLSPHFALMTGNRWNWLIIFLTLMAGVLLRHWRNAEFITGKKQHQWLAAAAVLFGIVILMAQYPSASADSVAVPAINDAQAQAIIDQRCALCHAAKPESTVFTAPPLGFTLDTMDEIKSGARQILNRAVEAKDMPLGNETGMTDEERQQLGAWLRALD